MWIVALSDYGQFAITKRQQPHSCLQFNRPLALASVAASERLATDLISRPTNGAGAASHAEASLALRCSSGRPGTLLRRK